MTASRGDTCVARAAHGPPLRKKDDHESRRFHVVFAMLLLLVPSPATADPAGWPMVRQNPGGSGSLRLAAPGPDRGWQFQVGSHVWGYQPGMAVWSTAALGVVQGRAVVLAGSYDNNLYCLDAATGGKRWRFTTGGGIYHAPALWVPDRGAALVFASSTDRLVYAVDADLGRRVWVHAVKTWRPTMGGARLSAPAVGRAGKRAAVFVGHWIWDKSMAGHLQAGGLTALAARTGKQLWTTKLGDNQISSPIYSGQINGQQRVFVGSESGNLHSLDAASGKLLWSFTDREAIKGNPALFVTPAGARVVFGSKWGRVRCLDAATGKELWRMRTGHWVDGSPAVARVGGRTLVLVGSYDNQLYALDARTGAKVWSYRTAGGIYSSPAVFTPADGKQRVLITAWDHHLHCLSAADGTLLWSAFVGRPIWDSITLGDSIWASPSVALSGGKATIYLGSYAGPLYAMPLAEARNKALARPSSNLGFWFTMPVVMLLTAMLTIFLTRRHRRREKTTGAPATR